MNTSIPVKALALGLLCTTGMAAVAATREGDTGTGGGGCGWGNMVWEGKHGLPPYLLASTTNMTSGNATFGMTSGTNGCDTSKTIRYGGKSWLNLAGMLDSIAEDMAQGQGEALDAYATLLGVEQVDRAHFARVTHDNFGRIFSRQDVTGEEVLDATLQVMRQDPRLARYADRPA
ncbi:DUF3015 domain-containing protein [Azotobacter bryophylli]|uniref:DUF3015 domain-containing protein n=1 Tax=Azotobacter bryophylli TaxID=1986537 RepID=A0ABV7AMV3_9GAMM